MSPHLNVSPPPHRPGCTLELLVILSKSFCRHVTEIKLAWLVIMLIIKSEAGDAVV